MGKLIIRKHLSCQPLELLFRSRNATTPPMPAITRKIMTGIDIIRPRINRPSKTKGLIATKNITNKVARVLGMKFQIHCVHPRKS